MGTGDSWRRSDIVQEISFGYWVKRLWEIKLESDRWHSLYVCIDTLGLIFEIPEIFSVTEIYMYWNLIINFDWNIIEIEITKYKHSTGLSCNITTLPVGLSDTQMGVCRVYVFMYGLRRLSRVEVSN